MKKILFVTGIRSDYFIQRPIIEEVRKSKKLKEVLVVTGAHLKKNFGYTFKEIKKDKYNIKKKIQNVRLGDSHYSRAKSASLLFDGLVDFLKNNKVDIIISPYDREEAIATALAGAYLNIPVAHIGAGDRTRVNIDGVIRHSVSKLSNLFFCFTKKNAERILKLGEEKWRVYNTGHVAIDRYIQTEYISLEKIKKKLNLSFTEKKFIVLIQHPVSNWINQSSKHFKQTLKAVDFIKVPTIIIKSNSDPGSNAMHKEYKNYVFKKNKKVFYFENLEEKIFVNLMKNASLLIGNSSMGVLESPTLKIPVVNIGLRQKDRQNAGNIIFVQHNYKKIMSAMRKSLFNLKYRKKIQHLKNPYGSGQTAKKIVKILEKVDNNSRLLNKKITY